MATCIDCGLPYQDHGSDITLPHDQWEMINPEIGGVLCGRCIAVRVSQLPGTIAIRAYIDFGDRLEGKLGEMITKVEALFYRVMDDLGHKGWRVRWMISDAFCWSGKKIIDMCPMHSVGECKQLLLHEIAHIKVVESSGGQHTLRFWVHLEGLIQKYLHSSFGPRQVYMAETYCPEFVQGEHLTGRSL